MEITFFFLLILLCYLNVAEDEEEFTICQDGDDDRENTEYQVKLSRIVIDKACLHADSAMLLNVTEDKNKHRF